MLPGKTEEIDVVHARVDVRVDARRTRRSMNILTPVLSLAINMGI
jgi:hypothetical protein